MNKAEYQKYLASREWALLKKEVKQRSGGRCERCHLGRYESTHHLTYERVGHEKLEDLLGICSACHQFLSGLTEIDPLIEAIRRKTKLLATLASALQVATIDSYLFLTEIRPHDWEDAPIANEKARMGLLKALEEFSKPLAVFEEEFGVRLEAFEQEWAEEVFRGE